MTQRWEDLLLLHWPVDAEELSKTLPDDLELDLFEGRAWASVVGFRLSELRFSPIPWIPWNDFLEVNLRTYARDRKGRRGVWFHSSIPPTRGPCLGPGSSMVWPISIPVSRWKEKALRWASVRAEEPFAQEPRHPSRQPFDLVERGIPSIIASG